MPDEMQMRTAGPGDARVLARLCAEVQALHARQRPDVFKDTDAATLEAWFRAVLAEGSATAWIGAVGGEAAGYVLVREERRPGNAFCHDRRWLEVDQIHVHPTFQRRGVARALLGRAAAFAAAAGVHEVELNAWHFNGPARSAFARLGFRVKTLRFARQARS